MNQKIIDLTTKLQKMELENEGLNLKCQQQMQDIDEIINHQTISQTKYE